MFVLSIRTLCLNFVAFRLSLILDLPRVDILGLLEKFTNFVWTYRSG